MNKQDMVLNNLQWLISHKTKQNIAQLARAIEYTDCFSAEG